MKKLIRNSTAEFLIFTSQSGEDSIEARVEDNSIWQTQKLIAELFGKSVSTVNEHIKNIYAESELEESDTLRKFGNSEFSTKPTNFYNLDLIISVGYRVNSVRATQFRQWATKVLKIPDFHAEPLNLINCFAYSG
ncbi:MAG: virulence RhuM family protein [Gammaproteobacteria bacterium]|nr:virulence RhuM family protein [Gammaproteobacteria bacterium]